MALNLSVSVQSLDVRWRVVASKKSTGVDNVRDCSVELLPRQPANEAAECIPSVIHSIIYTCALRAVTGHYVSFEKKEAGDYFCSNLNFEKAAFLDSYYQLQ